MHAAAQMPTAARGPRGDETADIPTILDRTAEGTGGALVRADQPLSERFCGFDRRLPVEGHQRGRQSRCAHDRRAPPVLLDGCDFDQIVASADGFFKAMYVSVHGAASFFVVKGTHAILRTARRETSEAPYETRVHSLVTAAAPEKKIFRVGDSTGNPP